MPKINTRIFNAAALHHKDTRALYKHYQFDPKRSNEKETLKAIVDIKREIRALLRTIDIMIDDNPSTIHQLVDSLKEAESFHQKYLLVLHPPIKEKEKTKLSKTEDILHQHRSKGLTRERVYHWAGGSMV